MIPELREKYNSEFTGEKYQAYLNELNGLYPGQMDFRVAETPVFIPAGFRNKMLDACDRIIEVVSQPGYKKLSDKSIPDNLVVPGEDAFPHFIAFDFGVCINGRGALEPQLIEMQGFPSLFAWQAILPEIYRKHFFKPEHYSEYLNGYNRNSYVELMQRIIVGDENPQNVILLEIFPEQQKTRIDFYATESLLGIKTVCLTQLIQEGRKLYYERDGKPVEVKRIFNRVIFDDLFHQPEEVREKGRIFQQELDVTWVPHPNWFYRISKFTLPYISHPYVPETHFLNAPVPDDLENYVVKPLFSFAGQGVIIDVKKSDIESIPDRENWIIQRKVTYAPVIETPGEPAKLEIRIFYFCEPGKKPVAVNNLARLSKGKMIGVRYNKDKDWVGGSFCLFGEGK